MEDFGLIVRNGRSRKGDKRGVFAKLIGVKRDIMNCVEHGNPPNMRRALVRMINQLDLPEKERNQAFNLLRQFCPRRQKNVKFHLNCTALEYRRRPRER